MMMIEVLIEEIKNFLEEIKENTTKRKERGEETIQNMKFEIESIRK